MLDAKLMPSNQGKLWTKFVQAATILSNNLVTAGETKTPTELFFGKLDAKLLDHLQILGMIVLTLDLTTFIFIRQVPWI
jgi:hypothetical protein